MRPVSTTRAMTFSEFSLPYAWFFIRKFLLFSGVSVRSGQWYQPRSCERNIGKIAYARMPVASLSFSLCVLHYSVDYVLWLPQYDFLALRYLVDLISINSELHCWINAYKIENSKLLCSLDYLSFIFPVHIGKIFSFFIRREVVEGDCCVFI